MAQQGAKRRYDWCMWKAAIAGWPHGPSEARAEQCFDQFTGGRQIQNGSSVGIKLQQSQQAPQDEQEEDTTTTALKYVAYAAGAALLVYGIYRIYKAYAKK